MGLFRGLAKAGLAKKAIDMARRPENQAKAKQAFNRLKNSRGGGKQSSGKRH